MVRDRNYLEDLSGYYFEKGRPPDDIEKRDHVAYGQGRFCASKGLIPNATDPWVPP